jgi:predicted dienelactone hydrolase
MTLRRAVFLFILSMAWLSAACAGGKCPTAHPVGVEKPPPANPITARYERSQPATGVEIFAVSLVDASRNRPVPIRAYLPATTAQVPLVLFSHGLGSSRDGYKYLGTAWAQAGYAVIHVDHADSDASLSLLTLYKASYAPEVWKSRPRDISFVIDALERHDPLLERVWSRADLTHIGVGGHSLGAQTALNIAGVLMSFKDGEQRVNMADKRVKAVVDLSPPFMPASPDPSFFAPVKIPLLHMAGTADENPAFDTLLCHKRVPFDWISGPPQYLVWLDGAIHRSFAGENEAQGKDIDFYHAMIVDFTTAFWDAMLRDDAHAREWLDRVSPARTRVERK